MSKSRGPQRSRRLSVENLESRAMMATVSAAGGLLFITGNPSPTVPDIVNVTQTTTGQIQVTGAGTTRSFSGITGIYADLLGGNDSITLGTPNRPLPLLSSVTLRLGDGSDTATVSVNIPGAVTVDGGMQFVGTAQNDIVNIDRSLIGSLSVNTYLGDDQLNISRSGILSLSAMLGTETVAAGQRDYDLVDISSSAIGSAFLSLGGSGVASNLGNQVFASSTIFGILAVNGGSGVDTVTIDSLGEGIGTWLPSHIVNTAQTLEPLLNSVLSRLPITSLLGNLDGLLDRLPSLAGVSLPGGIDIGSLLGTLGNFNPQTFDLSDSLAALLANVDLSFVGDNSVIGTLSVNTFGGADTVNVSVAGFLSTASINTGDGADNVNLTGVTASSLLVMLGAGADNLRLLGVTSNTAFLDGGAGIDGLQNTNNTNLGRRSRTIINFEVPLVVTFPS
jgi:hypothetical protein